MKRIVPHCEDNSIFYSFQLKYKKNSNEITHNIVVLKLTNNTSSFNSDRILSVCVLAENLATFQN